MNNSLWQIYQQTYFRWSLPTLAYTDFSILSAHNPLGEILCEADNLKLHQSLESKLLEQDLIFSPILAGDKAFRFTEPSFAIELCLTDSIQLARELIPIHLDI